jgi:exonuclease SbcC
VVCGATEHPASGTNHENVSDAEIIAAMDALEKQQDAVVAKKTEILGSEKAISEADGDMKQANEKLETLQAKLVADYQPFVSEFNTTYETVQLPVEFDAEIGASVIAELTDTLTNQETDRDKLNELIQANAEQSQKNGEKLADIKQAKAVAETQRNKVQSELSEINEKAPELRTKTEYQSELDALLPHIAEHTKQLNAKNEANNNLAVEQASLTAKQSGQQETVEKLTTEEKETNVAIKQAITDAEFEVTRDQLDSWLAELAQKDIVNELSSAITTHKTKLQQEQARVDELSQKVADQQQPDIAVLEQARTEADVSRGTITKELTLTDVSLQHATKAQTDVANIQQTAGEQAKVAEELGKLANAVDGTNEQRLPLERYVLQSYLQEVLNYANVHYFGNVSNGRYQFEIKQEKASRANQTGLEINIKDNDADELRSADTLSGGESFLAALSIALSIAAVIQNHAGGVEIDALFIDEGFGSLDGETLEKAMELLDQVEKEGRMIGLISHVDSMKARIPQQLKITKKGNAQSEINYLSV